jgi:hypothetical protein
VADECADPSELWQAAWLGGANGPVRGPMKFVNQLATTGWNSVLAYYQSKQQLQQQQQLQKNRQQQQQSQQQQNQIYWLEYKLWQAAAHESKLTSCAFVAIVS